MGIIFPSSLLTTHKFLERTASSPSKDSKPHVLNHEATSPTQPTLRVRVPNNWFRVSGLGFKVWGFRFKVQGLGLKVWGLRFRVLGLRFRGAGLRPKALYNNCHNQNPQVPSYWVLGSLKEREIPTTMSSRPWTTPWRSQQTHLSYIQYILHAV